MFIPKCGSPTRMLARMLLSVLFLILIGASLATAQKGKPSPCTKPSVAPPDTSCFLGPGCRDASFNGNGFLVENQPRVIRSVRTSADGKIIAIGEGARSPDSPTGDDVLLMSFNADGSRDTTFGEVDISNPLVRSGQTHISVTPGTEFVQGGELQPDGKILAGGWSTGIWWVVRTMPDGTLDPTFDGDGIRTVASGSGLWDMALQPDGKIVVGGQTNFNLTRLKPDGSLDASFGNGGTAVHNPSTNSRGSGHVWSITFQRVAATPNEDRIVVGGWSVDGRGGSSSFAVMRIRSDGTADSTFGTGGKVKTSFFGTGDQVREIRVDPSNRIVAAGITRINSCSQTDFAIARYLENGQLDPSFGTQGKASLDLYNDGNSVYALTVQPDGKPIIGGNAVVLLNTPNQRYYFALVRFDTAGNLDPTFGPGTAGPGLVTTVLDPSRSSYIFSLHQQSDGKILAGGTSFEKPAIARYLP